MAEDKISLIIPMRDEEGSANALLASVFEQSRIPDEVVIADGGSTDRTPEIVRSFIDKGYPVNFIKSGDAYPGKARNIAIEASRNELIAMTDAGITVDKAWLENLYKKIKEDASVDVVYGVFEPKKDTIFKRYSSIAFVPPKRHVDGRQMRTFFLASMLLKKRVWRDIGGLPEDLRSAEDRIFMEEIKAKGYKTLFAPDALVTWDIPRGPKELFGRFFLYSYHGARAGRMKDWHIPVIRIYSVLLLMAAMGIVISPLFFYAPLLLLMARAFGLILEREEGGLWHKLDPMQFAVVFFCMLLIDAAMFSGMVKYFLINRKERCA
ncbi:MAG: glycosyltransferase [Candidatus Omnitrophota bacterium]